MLGRRETLSKEGIFSASDIEAAGTCTLELPDAAELFGPSLEFERTFPLADRQHEVAFDLEGLPSISLATGHRHHIIVTRPLFHRVELDTLRTHPGSALLIPNEATSTRHPFEGVLAALAHLSTTPGAVLSLVGHLAPDDPETKPDLGLRRAQGLSAILRNERDAWVDIATSHGKYEDVIPYLRYLGARRRWSVNVPDETPSEPTAESRAAVDQFQSEYNHRFDKRIYVDGICGPQTLGALFDVLRFELERWMEKHDLSSENLRLHPSSPVLDAAAEFREHPNMYGPATPDNRRCVDLLLFDPSDLKLPSALTPGSLYDHPFARLETLEVHAEAGDWEFGTLRLVTDLGEHQRSLEEKYRLFADDGSYDIELTVAVDGVLRDNAIELSFDGIPVGPKYALEVINDSGERSTVFADLPYPKFHSVAVEADEEAS